MASATHFVCEMASPGFRGGAQKNPFIFTFDWRMVTALMDVTWISDQDEFVGNEQRLDDAQKIAARISTLYLQHTLRVFAMNTTQIDGPDREYEDLVAIPDLAAGMLAELSSTLAKGAAWSDLNGKNLLEDGAIQIKSDVISNWFWCECANIRRTCIVLDKVGNKSRVFKLDKL